MKVKKKVKKERRFKADPKTEGTPTNEFQLGEFIVEGLNDKDIPSLYGKAPERDLYTLWKDKSELTDSSEDVSLTHSLFAEKAIEIFKTELVTSEDTQLRRSFAQNKAMPFMRALLDLACFKTGIIIRVVVLNPEEFERGKSHAQPVRFGQVPERYWFEIQHQLMVTGLQKAYFVATVDGTYIRSVVVRPDPHFIPEHIAKCIEFWDCVRRGVMPEGAKAPPIEGEETPDETSPDQLQLTSKEATIYEP